MKIPLSNMLNVMITSRNEVGKLREAPAEALGNQRVGVSAGKGKPR